MRGALGVSTLREFGGDDIQKNQEVRVVEKL
jgi:hypothetical protein